MGLELVGLATTVTAMAVGVFLYKTKRKKMKRRTSLSSAFQTDRVFLEKNFAMKQNMVNAILCFDDNDAPSRKDMIVAMTKLAMKFERMRCRPVWSTPKGRTCEWEPIHDLEAAIDRAITEETVPEHAMLQRIEEYKSQILSSEDENGAPMPYWRVVVLKPSTVLVRIDHCIGDGLSLVTLLREIGERFTTDSETTPTTIDLGDLSPLLRHFVSIGDWRIFLRPLLLVWPPNLWRAVSFVIGTFSLPKEPSNPLRPKPDDLWQVIPDENCGTVYFPTMSLSLFKKLAAGVSNDTTINDVLLFCLATAFRRYFNRVGVHDIDHVRLVLPIANPLPPSLYGDEVEGLCNHMTPVLVPLDISSKIETKPAIVLSDIQAWIAKVKRSHAPLFLTTLNTVLDRFLTIELLASGGRDLFERASCVYSNVPGPTIPISIAGHKLLKIQTILPHPMSIFQVLSYNGNVFFNITLDTRAAPRPWLLRDAFVEAIRSFALTWDIQDSDVLNEISRCATSDEWGGRNVVFTCGANSKRSR